ncbi:hypothetical protein P9112_000225 [Eukaryota sp. TZLM1-RC]
MLSISCKYFFEYHQKEKKLKEQLHYTVQEQDKRIFSTFVELNHQKLWSNCDYCLQKMLNHKIFAIFKIKISNFLLTIMFKNLFHITIRNIEFLSNIKFHSIMSLLNSTTHFFTGTKVGRSQILVTTKRTHWNSCEIQMSPLQKLYIFRIINFTNFIRRKCQ